MRSRRHACDTGTTGLSGVSTIQIYRNGFFLPWGGQNLELHRSNRMGVTTQFALKDNISGDASVLLISLWQHSGAEADGCIMRFTTSSNTVVDMAAYYPSGHLQFNIRLAETIEFTSITMRGYAGLQFGSVPLNLASLSTTHFTHVSIPIASLYPAAAVGTLVAIPFEMRIRGTVKGTLMPALYVSDVRWTTQ